VSVQHNIDDRRRGRKNPLTIAASRNMARRQAEANPYDIGVSDIEGQRVEAAAIDTAWQAAGRGEAREVVPAGRSDQIGETG